MKERLIGLFNIKVESINENIKNLNYLNSEKDKTTDDLKFIDEKLSLLKPEEVDVLKFLEVNTYDFNKILSMLDGEVSDIFSTKSCNYEGILYIIQGINQGISLTLTEEQTNAILKLVEAMSLKKENLHEVILNLEKSKEELPETDLSKLESDLDKYHLIVKKLANNKYLIEIDDVIEVLDFNNVEVLERIELFTYLLKYNSDIYQNTNHEEEYEIKEEYPQQTEELDMSELTREPINFYEEKEDTYPELNEYETDLINLDDTIKFTNPFSYPEDLEKEEEEERFKTTDLEDIIKRIDEKLALLEEENKNNEEKLEEVTPDIILPSLDEHMEIEKPVEIPISVIEPMEVDPVSDNNLEETLENVEVNNFVDEEILDVEKFKEILVKYEIDLSLVSEFDLNSSLNLEKVDSILGILQENQILDYLKLNNNYLKLIILNQTEENLNNVIQNIKDKLSLDTKNYQFVIEIIIETLPTILTSFNISKDFLLNVEFFEREQINLINLFDNYRELLIVENNELEKNKEIVEKYQLKLNNDNVKYLLYSNNILEKLDYYTEAYAREKGFLGTYDEFDGIFYIKNYPYKLNSISKDVLMKLKYALSIDKKIFGNKPGILSGEITNPKVTTFELPIEVKNSYFNGNYDFLSLDENISLTNELKNILEFDVNDDEYIQKLDSLYKKDDLRYEINGLLLSRMKTIRLYNYLKKKNIEIEKALIIALTYNSVITNDDYQALTNVITNLLKGEM